MSLRLRLSLLFLALLATGVLAVVGRSVEVARAKVHEDLRATNFLTTQLLGLFFQEQQTQSPLPADRRADFYSRLAQLENAQGFDIEIRSATRSYPQFNGSTGSELVAPRWFVNLLDIDEELLIGNLGEVDGDAIVIRTDPVDALNGIWIETRRTILVRIAGFALFSSIVYLVVGYWLKPVDQIVRVLDAIVQGDFSRRVPLMSMPEFDRISRRINHLTGVLGTSQEDNARLTRESLTAREQERRYFAQELHDSLGQAVSAIKAMAVSIDLRTRTSDTVVADSARRIEKISDGAYASVRDLMAWLRPAVLDELGLAQALQTMVDDWNQHHEDTFCRLRMDGEFGDLREVQRINLYRIVQEALTNTAKHAGAELVNVVLSGQEVISLIINDNGCGFDQELSPRGMGLSGIRDRVNLLQGTLTLTSAPGKGTSLYMEIPRVVGFRRRTHDSVPA